MLLKEPENITLNRNTLKTACSALNSLLNVLEVSDYQNNIKNDYGANMDELRAFLNYVSSLENKQLKRQIYSLMLKAKELQDFDKYNELQQLYNEM